jgi:hypothetical protein
MRTTRQLPAFTRAPRIACTLGSAEPTEFIPVVIRAVLLLYGDRLKKIQYRVRMRRPTHIFVPKWENREFGFWSGDPVWVRVCRWQRRRRTAQPPSCGTCGRALGAARAGYPRGRRPRDLPLRHPLVCGSAAPCLVGSPVLPRASGASLA